MAECLAPNHYDRLHHYIADGVWNAAPLEAELAVQADRLVGGSDAVLVIDDTALPKKGDRSVGVAPQYTSALGKRANCQTLVTALADRGSSTWHPPLNEGPVVGTTFDDGVHDTRHLGGDCGHCLAAQIGIVAIPRDVGFEFVTKAILALADGDPSGDPQGAAQPYISRSSSDELPVLDLGRLVVHRQQELRAIEQLLDRRLLAAFGTA